MNRVMRLPVIPLASLFILILLLILILYQRRERGGLFHDPGWSGFRSTNHETPLRCAFFIFHKFLNQACGLLRNFFKMKNPNYRWDLMIY
jgi:hypothetical protein